MYNPVWTPREAAIFLLMKQRLHSLFIDPAKLILPRSIVIDSMQSFCRTTNMSFSQLSENKDTKDGLTLIKSGVNSNIYVILYNADRQNLRRRAFTIAHELGHIYLMHNDDGGENETQADIFASELLMPQILLHQCIIQGKESLSQLLSIFNVSKQAMEMRLEHPASNETVSLPERQLLKRMTALIPSHEGPVITL